MFEDIFEGSIDELELSNEPIDDTNDVNDWDSINDLDNDDWDTDVPQDIWASGNIPDIWNTSK